MSRTAFTDSLAIPDALGEARAADIEAAADQVPPDLWVKGLH
jgi:hypothetical protein